MGRVLLAILVRERGLLGRLRPSLLVFTDRELMFIRGVRREGGGLFSTLSHLAEGISASRSGGLSRFLDSIRGLEVDPREVMEIAGRGSLAAPYREVESIEVELSPAERGARFRIATAGGRVLELAAPSVSGRELRGRLAEVLESAPELGERLLLRPER